MSEKIYGIDLGTTNSIIGAEGKLLSRLVSSAVNFKTCKVTSNIDSDDNVYKSYKVNMGLGKTGELPQRASSIVIQNLVDLVWKNNHEIVKRVVISVPAYFSSNQRRAVRQSAEMIGLEVVSMINEPTAAAIQVCSPKSNIESIKRGVYVIYDLGGGTFDTTIVDSRSGKYHVIGTDGCILGGDNLDIAIRDFLFDKAKIPQYKRTPLILNNSISIAIETKLKMQQANNDFAEDNYSIVVPIYKFADDYIEVDMTLLEYKTLVEQIFSKTIAITNMLIKSKIDKGVDFNLVFVGGSTHCSHLTYYVSKSLGISLSKILYDRNPDFTVVNGVIKYAYSLQNNEEDLEFKDVTKQFSISDENDNAIVIIPANSNIPCNGSHLVSNYTTASKLLVNLYQGNSISNKNNELLGFIEYDYGIVQEKGEGLVEVSVFVDINGLITLEVEDFVNFQPKRQLQLKGF